MSLAKASLVFREVSIPLRAVTCDKLNEYRFETDSAVLELEHANTIGLVIADRAYAGRNKIVWILA